MQRKVIKLGNSTLVVSLPQKWVRQNKIEAGSKVNVTEATGELLIETESQIDRKAEIDVTHTPLMSNRILAAQYMTGHDEIVVRGTPELMIKSMRRAEKCMNMEVIEQTDNHIVLESFGEEDAQALPKVVDRMRFLALQIVRQAEKAFDNDAEKQLLLEMEDNINKFHQYGIRLLYKDRIRDTAYILNTVQEINALEQISDSYKYLVELTSELTAKQQKNLRDSITFIEKCVACARSKEVSDAEELASWYADYEKQLDVHTPFGRQLLRIASRAWDIPLFSLQ